MNIEIRLVALLRQLREASPLNTDAFTQAIDLCVGDYAHRAIRVDRWTTVREALACIKEYTAHDGNEPSFVEEDDEDGESVEDRENRRIANAIAAALALVPDDDTPVTIRRYVVNAAVTFCVSLDEIVSDPNDCKRGLTYRALGRLNTARDMSPFVENIQIISAEQEPEPEPERLPPKTPAERMWRLGLTNEQWDVLPDDVKEKLTEAHRVYM